MFSPVFLVQVLILEVDFVQGISSCSLQHRLTLGGAGSPVAMLRLWHMEVADLCLAKAEMLASTLSCRSAQANNCIRVHFKLLWLGKVLLDQCMLYFILSLSCHPQYHKSAGCLRMNSNVWSGPVILLTVSPYFNLHLGDSVRNYSGI